MLLHHWAALLPGCRPGEALLRLLPRPKQPLVMCHAASA
jgi:hypothetical protein